jgi:DNA-binding response OmpR family regulator
MIIFAGKGTDSFSAIYGHLREARMQAKRVQSTAHTLEEIEWDNPGVLITNLEFEGIDGLEFVRRIRGKNKPKYSEVPILALTEETSKEHILKLLEAGVSDVMICPCDPGAFRIRAHQSHNGNYARMLREVDPVELQTLPDRPNQKDLDALLIEEGSLDGFKDPLVHPGINGMRNGKRLESSRPGQANP